MAACIFLIYTDGFTIDNVFFIDNESYEAGSIYIFYIIIIIIFVIYVI